MQNKVIVHFAGEDSRPRLLSADDLKMCRLVNIAGGLMWLKNIFLLMKTSVYKKKIDCRVYAYFLKDLSKVIKNLASVFGCGCRAFPSYTILQS